jgi:hypothetical protein
MRKRRQVQHWWPLLFILYFSFQGKNLKSFLKKLEEVVGIFLWVFVQVAK